MSCLTQPPGWGTHIRQWHFLIWWISLMRRVMLQNSCPYTTYPTSSSPPTLNHTSPSMNSLLHQTSTGTFPHSSPTPCSLRWNSIPFLDVSPLFHLSCAKSILLFHQSFGPLVSILYLICFPLQFCSYCATALQHRLSALFLLSPISFSFIGQPTLLSHYLSLKWFISPYIHWSMCWPV